MTRRDAIAIRILHTVLVQFSQHLANVWVTQKRLKGAFDKKARRNRSHRKTKRRNKRLKSGVFLGAGLHATKNRYLQLFYFSGTCEEVAAERDFLGGACCAGLFPRFLVVEYEQFLAERESILLRMLDNVTRVSPSSRSPTIVE